MVRLAVALAAEARLLQFIHGAFLDMNRCVEHLVHQLQDAFEGEVFEIEPQLSARLARSGPSSSG